MTLRTYAVRVRGFPFDHVHVRARSRARARYLCAKSFHEAGWGTIGDGLRTIVGTRREPAVDSRPLVASATDGEGLVAVR